MATTSRCCAATSGAPRRTRPATCSVTCAPGSMWSTSAAVRARSRSTSPAWSRRGVCSASTSSGDVVDQASDRAARRRRREPHVRAGRCLRPGRRRCVVRRRPRPPVAPAPERPDRRVARGTARAAPGRARRRARQRLLGVRLGADRPAPRPLDAALPPHHPAQRGPSRRRAMAAALGGERRLRRRARRRARRGRSPIPSRRAWWGGLWADRVRASSFNAQALAYGLADAGELADIAVAFEEWAAMPSAVFVVVHVEVLARRPTP